MPDRERPPDRNDPGQAVPATSLRKTVLHAWHRANGGRLVEFAGFEMPVQYRDGIVAEHLATRRAAGLFDVSHMGRFRLRGPDAEAALRRVLTNDAAALPPGRAHYTFLANERGGAEDDAYLYRAAADDFLLVVNASNRARGFELLAAGLEQDGGGSGGGGTRLTDESEALAMIALQGPLAARMLEAAVPRSALPEDRRNRHARTRFEGAELLIARTGYTGEAVCFELFVETRRAEALWTRLAAAGAAPAGLGARDSLRLQAGLPLYGHELGTDPDGAEIPIFANALARFGVRPPGGSGSGSDDDGGYTGRAALEAQRAEYGRIRQGGPGPFPLLPRVIVPIAAAPEGRRPFRAGQRVMRGGRPVGLVTSGTSVPTGGEDAGGRPELRPIGLALVDSALPFRGGGGPGPLQVLDARGNECEAVLVASHLPPDTPRRSL